MADWNTLPSIILVEIFSYLERFDQIQASSVCTIWRECLFHPLLCSKVCLTISNSSQFSIDATDRLQCALFLSRHCGRFAKEIVLRLGNLQRINLHEFSEILENFSSNVNIRKLIIQTSSCQIDVDVNDKSEASDYVTTRLISCIQSVIKNSRRLELLALGSLEELVNHSETFLLSLSQWNHGTLKSLHISSIKEDPDDYVLLDIPPEMFQSFCSLQKLTMDFDYLCDDLIDVFSSSDRVPLLSLELYVHGIDPDHPLVSDYRWNRLSSRCPNLEVGLTLLHSTEPSHILADILSPSIPLHHFRSYFTWFSDSNIVQWMRENYSSTLRTFILVESLNEWGRPPLLFTPNDDTAEHPLVMLLWQCTKITNFTVIGYEINCEELIAYGRLRGSQLQQLKIPQCCVSVYSDDSDGNVCFLDETSSEEHCEIISDVSNSLSRQWSPLKLHELPAAVVDPKESADATYLPELLALQLD